MLPAFIICFGITGQILRLFRNSDKDMGHRGGSTAAVVGASHNLQTGRITVPTQGQVGEGIGKPLVVIGIVPLHMLCVLLHQSGKFVPGAVQIGPQEQVAQTAGIVVVQKLFQMAIPVGGFEAVLDPQRLQDRPGDVGLLADLQIQLTEALSAAAGALEGLIVDQMPHIPQGIPQIGVAYILLGTPEGFVALELHTGGENILPQFLQILLRLEAGLVQNVRNGDPAAELLGAVGLLAIAEGVQKILIVKAFAAAVELIDHLGIGLCQLHIPVDAVDVLLQNAQVCIGTVHGIFAADEDAQHIALTLDHSA